MKRKVTVFLVLVLLCLAAGSVILAAPGSPFGGPSISWWTVDGGGGQSAVGDYQLSGTIGQADAHLEMAGNSYTMAGGYWVRQSGQSSNVIYLPVITTPE